MHLIAYISDSNIPADSIGTSIDSIVAIAKKENSAHGITGVLFFESNKFLQVIEGEEAELRQLMKNIEADRRHESIKYLIDCKIEERALKDWNMDVFQLKRGKNFDAETLEKLTQDFEKSILPRSDALIFYYKSLLEEQKKGLKYQRKMRTSVR